MTDTESHCYFYRFCLKASSRAKVIDCDLDSFSIAWRWRAFAVNRQNEKYADHHQKYDRFVHLHCLLIDFIGGTHRPK